MKKVLKPWGYEDIWAVTDKYIGKIIFINPNQRLSLQYHENIEETIYVLSGTLRVWSSNDEKDFIELEPGGVYHVAPKKLHRFGCGPNPEGVRIAEVSTPEIDDVVRLSDDYGR